MSIDFDKNIDYYKILEISSDSDLNTIKSAYRNLIKNLKAHPDLGGSHENAVRINIAYKILSDVNTKNKYDTARMEMQNLIINQTKIIICIKCCTRNIINGEVTSRDSCCKCGEQFIKFKSGEIHALSPSPDMQLDEKTNVILNMTSEVIIELISDDVVRHCLRCGKSWESQDKPAVKEKCPACKSVKWSQFRLFQCKFCKKKFVTVDLYHWSYKIYPACPYCKKRAWNAGAEKNPIKWLLSKLSGV